MKFAVFFLLFISHFSIGQQDSITINEEPYSFPIIIYYKNNSAQISHVNQFRLKVLSEYLQENPQKNILIEGHVCCGPDYRVSKRRARSVYKNLLRLGVPKEQMKYIGKSFDAPRVLKEKTEEDMNLNRRVEIKIL